MILGCSLGRHVFGGDAVPDDFGELGFDAAVVEDFVGQVRPDATFAAGPVDAAQNCP